MIEQPLDRDAAAVLVLVPTTVTLFEEVDKEGHRQAIQMSLTLSRPKDLLTAKKRSLSKVQWIIRLISGASYNEHLSKMGAIGALIHCPYQDASWPSEREVPETCQVNVAIYPTAFTTLLNSAIQGWKPACISVHACGLLVGPDAIGVWDIDTQRIIPVVQVSYEMPLTR